MLTYGQLAKGQNSNLTIISDMGKKKSDLGTVLRSLMISQQGSFTRPGLKANTILMAGVSINSP